MRGFDTFPAHFKWKIPFSSQDYPFVTSNHEVYRHIMTCNHAILAPRTFDLDFSVKVNTVRFTQHGAQWLSILQGPKAMQFFSAWVNSGNLGLFLRQCLEESGVTRSCHMIEQLHKGLLSRSLEEL
jgi:hypothetical protein